MSIQCIILAGGLGTRMKQFTAQIPKAMIPVLGRPFLDYQLIWLANHGVTDVLYSIGYMGELIRDHVGNGDKWGLRVVYSDEGTDLRGTAGALRLALDSGLMHERFLMTYGDSFLPIDFGLVWSDFVASGSQALMTVFKNNGQWDKSNAIYDMGRVQLYEKNLSLESFKFIDYGLSALNRSVIAERVASGAKMDLAPIFTSLSKEGLLAGWESKIRFFEIGSPVGLSDFENWIRPFASKLFAQQASGHNQSTTNIDRGSAMIVLDRDGVLNEMVVDPEHGFIDSPLHPLQVRVYPWVPKVLAELTKAGFGLAIASNQPAFSKGKTTKENLEATHSEILRQAQAEGGKILGSFICYHTAEEHCSCRKPKPGLLEQIWDAFPQFFLADSWMVGDGITDIQVGQAMGLRTAFLGPKKCDHCKIMDEHLGTLSGSRPTFWGKNLLEFSKFVLKNMS